MPIAHERIGAALAIDAHENEPKSLRSLPPLMCVASHIQAVPVSAKNMASSEASSLSVAARNCGADGLEQIALPIVSLYETNLRSVATLIVMSTNSAVQEDPCCCWESLQLNKQTLPEEKT